MPSVLQLCKSRKKWADLSFVSTSPGCVNRGGEASPKGLLPSPHSNVHTPVLCAAVRHFLFQKGLPLLAMCIIFDDGNKVEIDLCQRCLKIMLGLWLGVSDPEAYHLPDAEQWLFDPSITSLDLIQTRSAVSIKLRG